MAEYRIRRWFQFGVLDLMIVVAISAVTALLLKPAVFAESQASDTAIFFGKWSDDDDVHGIDVRPDGSYSVVGPGFGAAGSRLDGFEPVSSTSNQFVLRFGHRGVTLHAPLGGITRLNAWGLLLAKKEFWSGPYRDGLPHGKWTRRDIQGKVLEDVEYRYGARKDSICFGGEDESPEVESRVGDSSGGNEQSAPLAPAAGSN